MHGNLTLFFGFALEEDHIYRRAEWGGESMVWDSAVLFGSVTDVSDVTPQQHDTAFIPQNRTKKGSILCQLLSLILEKLWSERGRWSQVILSTNHCGIQAPPTQMYTDVFTIFQMSLFLQSSARTVGLHLGSSSCSCLILFLSSHNCCFYSSWSS